MIENRPGALSESEKEKASARLAKLKILPRDRAEIRSLTARADRIYASLLGEERDRLGALMSEFEKVLAELGKDARVHVYEGADHAFANPSGTRYNAEAAEQAWKRTLAFFDLRLKG